MLFGALSLSAYSQDKVIKGSVLGSDSEPLSRASVTVVDTLSNVLDYTITDEKGFFYLELDSSISNASLALEVNYLGYGKKQIHIQKGKTTYNFILEEDATSLDEIIVKNRPRVRRKGDTINFRVSSFQKSEDRSIGDVLKRMPGVQIDEDGTIFFNGDKISNLYIQGDDLMEGKYGLATRAIRKEDIMGVDVIRNHQPIKVLQDRVLSNKTAMNLLLKDENSMSLSNRADLAGGVPGLYDASLTSILLNKKIKMLNTAALNNASVDYREDFKQLGSSNLRSDISQDPSLFSLSLGTVGLPDLPKTTYYLNRSRVINLNNLYTTKNNLQLKLNVQAFTDRNSLNMRVQ